MANEHSDSAVEQRNDNLDCPVILDGEEEQVEALTNEVSHKLNGLAHARKTKPWTRKEQSNDLTILEEQQNRQNNPDHDNVAGADDDGHASNKNRLGGLLNTFKSNDDDHNKHRPVRRPAFKPIRLAVAKARFPDNDVDSTAALPSIVVDKKTTLALPNGAEEPNASVDDVAADDDNDDARSYVDIPRAPSPTATYSSTSSSPTTTPDTESGIFQWLRRPNSKHNPASPVSTTTDLPSAEAGPSAGTTVKWKKHSKKGSKASSQGDVPESPQAIDYAEIDTMRPKHPKRSDTLLRGMMPSRSDSFNYKRNSSLRLPLPFRGRRKRRKGKGKMGDDGSSSEEGMDDEELFHETLRKAGLFDRDVPEQMVTEVLWQNERGISLLGTRYGKNALLPGDPGAWTDIHGQATSYNTSSFPLPTPAWRWHHSEWLISMIGDVDSEGYQYSTRFSSKYWRGIPEIRFFVRRRLWIRTRYRPTLKAQKIAEFTHPQAGIKGMEVAMPRVSLGKTLSSVPALRDGTSEQEKFLALTPTSQLDPRNPFISYYALKGASPHELGESPSPTNRGERQIPKKQEVVHANFIRVAKVLVRRTNVDRERLAWVEYWLGAREDALHVTDVSSSQDSTIALNAQTGRNNGGTIYRAPSLANIEEARIVRPDIRDVWDLLEDRLDDILGLFEYQETRRELLLLLRQLHNTSHPEHHYKNRSSSPDHPSEILAQHEHGTTDEYGANGATRAANGDGAHIRAEEVPRLAFWSDLEERLKGLQVTTGPVASRKGKPEPNGKSGKSPAEDSTS